MFLELQLGNITIGHLLDVTAWCDKTLITLLRGPCFVCSSQQCIGFDEYISYHIISVKVHRSFKLLIQVGKCAVTSFYGEFLQRINFLHEYIIIWIIWYYCIWYEKWNTGMWNWLVASTFVVDYSYYRYCSVLYFRWGLVHFFIHSCLKSGVTALVIDGWLETWSLRSLTTTRGCYGFGLTTNSGTNSGCCGFVYWWVIEKKSID